MLSDLANDYLKAITKDIILTAVNDKKFLSVYEIEKITGFKLSLISYLVEEMRDDGLVELMDVTFKGNRYIAKEYEVIRTNKGVYFLTFDGGHKKRIKQKMLSISWTIAKIIAAIANALAIILLTYLALNK